MPIPSIKSGETKNEFISRCVSAIVDEYGQDQSLGICYSTWDSGKMSKSTSQRVAEKIARLGQTRGINMENDGTIDMETPCWEGYEMIGTKIVNGKEVPNCVPIK